MKTSVIIPAYNEEKYLGRCLESILAQSQKPDEIIVIDNNSVDNTAAVAKAYGVHVVKEKKQGMIHARNRGFNEAQYDIIVRTDADAILPAFWVARIKNYFTKHPDVLAVSGPVKFYNGSKFSHISLWPTRMYEKAVKRTLQEDFLIGPNMALRKTAWQSVRKEVCLEDNAVHEDIDLTIHLAQHGRIFFDKRLLITVSARRWKKLKPYIEYPYRYIRTIQHHKQSLGVLEKSGKFVRRVIPRTKRTIKKVAETVRNPLRYL